MAGRHGLGALPATQGVWADPQAEGDLYLRPSPAAAHRPQQVPASRERIGILPQQLSALCPVSAKLLHRSRRLHSRDGLLALNQAGEIPVTDPAYRRGVAFLLRTQDDDGSWFVNKRALPLNDYFDAGFPHGQSQFSSFNATGWSTMALLLAVEPSKAGDVAVR